MKKQDVHREAMVNFDRIQSSMYQERKQCLEDRRFYSIAGSQWEGELEEQFEGRPKFEVNKAHLAVMKIINEYRNNRVTVDFVSKTGEPQDDLASTCNGLFRADEQDSGAEEAYDNAFEEAVGGGFGALRLISEYEDEEDGENDQQRIRIEPIYDADSSVFFDLDAKRQDKADAKYCFVINSTTPEDFEETWGRSPSSVDKEINYVEYDWFTADMVYIAEFYRVEEKKEKYRVFQGITGQEKSYGPQAFEENPDLERELMVAKSQEVRTKTVKTKKIHKYILSGNEILEDCGVIAGKNIPIVPVYGKRWYIDSVERCMGHVRLVKDVQRLKNMLTSKLAEISSLSPVEKPIFTPEQMSGHEIMWSEDNLKNYPYLLVNPVTDVNGGFQPVGPVAYVKPPQVPPALAALLQLVDMDIKELLGNHTEADKMLSHVSGKAQELIQKRVDGQAFIYMSNFAKSSRRVGEVWLSMAKEVYVEDGRKMKTLGSSGETSSVELNQMMMGVNGYAEEKNDLSKASFDVTVDVGPSSDSVRQSTVSTLTGMMSITQDPETMQVLQAMAMMNMEGEGIKDIRMYFRKKLLKMGVIPPTKEEAEEMAKAEEESKKNPSPQERALIGMADEAEAKAIKARTDVMRTMTETEKDKAQTKQILTETETEAALDIAKTRQIYSGMNT